MLKNTIKDYLVAYNFEDILSNLYKDFMSDTTIIKYLSNSTEDNFKNFAEEFWSNPAISTQLKKKHNIPNNISYSNIIKAYPTHYYIDFLKQVWNADHPINDLISTYCLPYKMINNLLIPIIYENKNCFCPNCLDSNKFFVTWDDVRYNNLYMHCTNCESQVKKFISSQEAESEMSIRLEKGQVFKEQISIVTSTLIDIKCPRCQENSFEVVEFKRTYKYAINCKKCNKSWDSIENLNSEYDKWKKRAAMMIAIRNKELELIEKALKNKKPMELLFPKEDIIRENEFFNSIDSIFNIIYESPELYWASIFKQIKSSSRSEKMILVKLIELSKVNSKVTVLQNKPLKLEMKFMRYSFEEPLVAFLFEETHILHIRKVIRNLMSKNIIACCEETNLLYIHPIIIDNIEKISSLLKPQNGISLDIKYLILKKENYTCYNCGETCRPLKVAYLSTDKNLNNLDKMVVVCDFCYDDVTENEVIIDGTQTYSECEDNFSDFTSWNFIVNNLPEIRGNDGVYKFHIHLLENYSEDNLIKALAATLHKFNTEDSITIKAFYKYTEGILKNSNGNGGEVKISKTVEKDYKVNDWIALLR